MDQSLRDAKNKLYCAVSTLNSSKDLSPSELDNLNKAVSALEKICKIEKDEWEMQMAPESGRSYGQMYHNFPNPVEWDMSFGRDGYGTSGARMRNPVNGQYMSNGNRMSYGRDGYGTSGHYDGGMKEETIERLRRKAREATNEQDRRDIEVAIEMLMNS